MAAITLPRLPVNWREQPQLFERYWDEAMSRLEDTLNAILQIPEIEQALEDLDAATQAALDAAANAQSAADNAQGAADSTAAETSIVNSYVANFTAPLITANDVGTVTIANHDRVYGDVVLNPTVSVLGDVINTGGSSGQIVRIYYDQPSRAGGSVTYQWTVDPTPPPVQGGDRHVIGTVTIPLSGSDDGKFIRPPGFVEN